MPDVDLRALIRDIPDFPRPGIVFKDITPLLVDAEALRHAIDLLAEDAEKREVAFVVAAEARGFILGAAVAARIGAGFVPARKPGKLPADTASVRYQLEYGVDALEVHRDALAGGARVLVHDDLLATGGTAAAKCRLVEDAGAVVAGCSFLVELAFLGGRTALAPHPVHSVIVYEGEQSLRAIKRSRTISSPRDELWQIVSDPAHLTRWWPKVERVEEATDLAWTTVLRSPKGRLVRADYTRVELQEPERIVWQQEIEESSFERFLSRSVTEIVLEPADGGESTLVRVTARQRLRGLARFGGFIVRRATGRQLTEALEQLDEIAGARA